ncbi:MAG: purine-nucleoside phosphorylase [Spirochaetales bacterium]|nr:purine-nucleoside phosphorylase [Spirochaetales bacterium]
MDLSSELDAAADKLRSHFGTVPDRAIVLGSGLGDFVELWTDRETLPYSSLPGLVPSTVTGHKGQFVRGKFGDHLLLGMQGRLHFYEGYSMQQIVRPVEIMARAGVKQLIVTNAAGAVNAAYQPGDLMLISDHINLMGSNPLVGRSDLSYQEKFLDLSAAYHPALRTALRDAARSIALTVQEGVYVAVSGPVYETPAEIRMYRALGADACGMSTIPEVITANRLRMQVAGISCITNMGAGITGDLLSHDEVTDIAARAMQNFASLMSAALPQFSRAML